MRTASTTLPRAHIGVSEKAHHRGGKPRRKTCHTHSTRSKYHDKQNSRIEEGKTPTNAESPRRHREDAETEYSRNRVPEGNYRGLPR